MSIKKIIFITFLASVLLAVQSTDEDFADQLFQTGDYPSAIYTYKKVIFLNKSNDNAKYKLARSFYLNGQKEESSTLLDELVENSATHKKVSQKELARQYFKNEDFDRAAFEFKDFSQTYNDSSALYLAGWSDLKQNDYQEASKTFGVLAEKKDSNFGLAALKLKDKVLEGEKLPQKNILAAQIMSGILPGSGQIYAGNWQDGLVSFLVNGLTISLLSNALQGKRSGEALVWLTLETAWYFGGIYSAGNSVHKYNEAVRTRFIEDLEDEYHPGKLLEQ